MKKTLLNYIAIISISILIILNGTTSIYAYNILGENDKILNVLVLNSYEYLNESEMDVLKGFEKKLEEIKPDDLKLNIELEYLDIRKRNDEKYLNSYGELLNSKYQEKDIDFVFTIDDEAFEFVKDRLFEKNSIFYKKKVLFTGVQKAVELKDEYKKYITGVLSSNTNPLADLCLNLHPNVDTINILLDNLSHSEVVKKRTAISKNLWSRNVKINYIQSDYIEDIASQLREVDGENQLIVLRGTFMHKNDKTPIDFEQIVNTIKSISINPMYTNNEAYIDKGVIGGLVDVGEKQGENVAKELNSILNEEKSEGNIIPSHGGTYKFNYEEIYNYDLDIRKIPKDSEIINRPPGAFLLPETVKITIFVVVVLIILLMINTSYKLFMNMRESNKNKQLYEKSKEREQLKTDFIVNMSHELRTPLNIILSTSKVTEMSINNKTYDDDYLLDKLEKININSKRLVKLVNNLIDITKYEMGSHELNLENLNIVEVVEDVVLASVDYSSCKDISLTFDTIREEIITAIDREKIERVILNLVSNSIKYSNKGGKIFVHIRKEYDEVFITVEDDGIGIPKDKLKEIFNRFYQVSDPIKKHEEGSGIGLCIVEEIVNLHKGKINVYSEMNKGTKFEIILPIYTVEKSFENVQISDLKEIVKLEMSDIDTK